MNWRPAHGAVKLYHSEIGGTLASYSVDRNPHTQITATVLRPGRTCLLEFLAQKSTMHGLVLVPRKGTACKVSFFVAEKGLKRCHILRRLIPWNKLSSCCPTIWWDKSRQLREGLFLCTIGLSHLIRCNISCSASKQKFLHDLVEECGQCMAKSQCSSRRSFRTCFHNINTCVICTISSQCITELCIKKTVGMKNIDVKMKWFTNCRASKIKGKVCNVRRSHFKARKRQRI